MKHSIAMTPVDAWFFRDSRPYNQGESHQTDAQSLFPPFAPTLVGALRAGLARERGWDGRTNWKAWGDGLIEVLGNGYEDLGQLDFCGPYLLRRIDGAWRRLYPAPMHLLGADDPDHDDKDGPGGWLPKAQLSPGPALDSDLGGGARLPTLTDASRRQLEHSNEGAGALSPPEDVWLTAEGYSDLLAGRLPSQDAVWTQKALWKTEQRIGLQLQPGKRSAKEGQLYSPSYIRPTRNTALGVQLDIKGVDEGWPLPNRMPLGGEHRLANLESCEFQPLELSADIHGTRTLTITFLTPARLDTDTLKEQIKPGGELGEGFGPLAGAKLISVASDKPVYIGGWNSVERRPMDLKPYLAPGTTLFVEVPEGRIDALSPGLKLGQRTAYGFGEIAIGTWNDGGTQ